MNFLCSFTFQADSSLRRLEHIQKINESFVMEFNDTIN